MDAVRLEVCDDVELPLCVAVCVLVSVIVLEVVGDCVGV